MHVICYTIPATGLYLQHSSGLLACNRRLTVNFWHETFISLQPASEIEKRKREMIQHNATRRVSKLRYLHEITWWLSSGRQAKHCNSFLLDIFKRSFRSKMFIFNRHHQRWVTRSISSRHANFVRAVDAKNCEACARTRDYTRMLRKQVTRMKVLRLRTLAFEE